MKEYKVKEYDGANWDDRAVFARGFTVSNNGDLIFYGKDGDNTEAIPEGWWRRVRLLKKL